LGGQKVALSKLRQYGSHAKAIGYGIQPQNQELKVKGRKKR
jgi:hypothetical protein